MSENQNKFAVAALMGAFADEAQFTDPFGLGTVFTVRRSGSNALQKIARERAKGDPLATVLAQSVFAEGRANLMELAGKAGLHPVDVLAGLSEAKVNDALARLVKWDNERNGVPYNAGTARALLTLDGWLDKALVPEEAWKILEDQARKEYEALKIPDREPFKGLEEIQVGDAYVSFIRYWSEQKEAFRASVLEEAAKN